MEFLKLKRKKKENNIDGKAYTKSKKKYNSSYFCVII